MVRRLAFMGLLVCWAGGWSWGQEAGGQAVTGEVFEQRSLALRTALFHEPSLDQPLRSLVEMYRQAGREEELIGLYRSHVAQYPDDAGSQAVMVRLLLELKRPEASVAAAAAADAHPGDALILYVRSVDLQRQRDPRALEVLGQAIAAEADLLRKAGWTDELVAAALAEDRRDLAEIALRAMLAVPDQSAAQRLVLAQRLNRDGFSELALEAVAAAVAANPSAELAVDLDLQAAAAEAALGRTEAAARRLDGLLARMAPDYARRREVVARRVGLFTTEADRAAHVQRAREVWAASPESEAAALDLAEWLVALERRREATEVLRTAGERLPHSSRLEKAILDLLDRLGDERSMREYLQARVTAHPERSDLVARLVSALFALGENAEAGARFDGLLEALAPDEQARRRLDMARQLRRMTLPAEAAQQLEKVLAAHPDRVDVRRELAEARLAANDPEGARRLMREAISEDATIENFLDVIAFMMAPDSPATWPEARDALRARRIREPKNFEVAMLLIEVLGRLGEQADGEAVVEATRGLADTETRYRRWLDGAMELAEAVGAEAAFFDAEHARLVAAAAASPDGWSPEISRRYLLFCEGTNRSEVEPQLVAALRARVDEASTPPELRVAARRLLVDALRRDPTQAVEVQNQLQVLASEDFERADEYRLRLARAGHEAAQRDGGRPDQVRELLRAVKVERVDDAALLRGAQTIFLDYGYAEPALAVLERLTFLEPGDAGHWERWISALAAQGDEERLRDALRRVLAGVTAEPLDAQSLDRLRQYLVDSCWRSIALLFAAEAPAQLVQVFPLLDLIERTRAAEADLLWVTWARGYALRRTGQPEAAEEAAAALEGQARRWFTDTSGPPRILFPDGLTVSVDHALGLLRDAGPGVARVAESPEGPERAPSMRWGFATDDGSLITQVEPVGEGEATAVVVLDQAGTLYAVEAETGKLRWRRTGLWAGPSSAPTPIARGRRVRSASGYFGADGNIPITIAPRIAVDEAGAQVVVSRDGELTALGIADGQVRWRADLPGVARRVPPQPGVMPLPPIPDEVWVDQAGRVILWRAETATAAAFQPQTGKLLWVREVALESPPPMLGPLNSGSSCDGTHLLVYGHQPCVIDTATGAVIWSFGGETVREFPVALASAAPTDGRAMGALPAAATLSSRAAALPGGGVGPRRVALNYLRPLTDRASVLGQWLSGKGVLVAPAVAWAEQSWQPIGGEVVRGRLVLTLPGLTLAPSLEFPLGGTRLEAMSGTYLGATGTRAVFLSELSLTLFDFARGGSIAVPLGIVATPPSATAGEAPVGPSVPPPFLRVEGVVAGPRVLVTGPGGVLAVNPLTGRILFAEPWPQRVRQFAGLDTAPTTPPAAAFAGAPTPRSGVQFTPRYQLHSSATSNIGLRPRTAARGRWLFAILGVDRLAGLAAD